MISLSFEPVDQFPTENAGNFWDHRSAEILGSGRQQNRRRFKKLGRLCNDPEFCAIVDENRLCLSGKDLARFSAIVNRQRVSR
jgi:hypothetical protein